MSPFLEAVKAYHTDVITTGIQAGHSLRIMNLSYQIEENLRAAEGRTQMAAEDPAMAAHHHRYRAQYIATARNLLQQEGGKEAHRLAKERIDR